MTAREKLQCSYELAFYPPRLNAVWQRISGSLRFPVSGHPTALIELVPILESGALIGLTAFGGGFTFGAAVIEKMQAGKA